MKMSKSQAGKLGAINAKTTIAEKKSKRISSYLENPAKCKNCDTVLSYARRHNVYCSSSCSASDNNHKRRKITVNACLYCNTAVKTKYCSVKCQKEYEYKNTIANWLNGEGKAGCAAIKRYLTETFGYKCQSCGITEYNGKSITLEIEHIDGNSLNNKLNNVCFLCPNCHSQTLTYKGKNKGNGRHSRRIRYAEGKSY